MSSLLSSTFTRTLQSAVTVSPFDSGTINTANIKSDEVVYSIYDLTGKMVDTGLFAVNAQKNIQQIEVDKLNTGLYFIELSVNGTSSTQKFIITIKRKQCLKIS